MNKCDNCGQTWSQTGNFILPCPICKWTPERLNAEDMNYLSDFIWKTLQNDDEDDPFDTEEASYLLELYKKLKNMGAKRPKNEAEDSDANKEGHQ